MIKILSVITLIVLLLSIVLWDISAALVHMDYDGLGISFTGRKGLGQRLSFHRATTLYLSSSFARLLSTDLVLYWNHRPYPITTLTSATLSSLGFSVRQFDADYRATFVKRGARRADMSMAVLSTARGAIERFELIAGKTRGACPFGISILGQPEISLPASREEILAVLGNPTRTGSVKTHPGAMFLPRFPRRFLPPTIAP